MINDIQSIPDYESMTSQQIADTLQASGVTHRAISRADLIHLLNMRGMLRKIVSNNDNEKWTGTVLNMQDAIIAGGIPEQQAGIRLWFSHVTNVSNVSWDTRQIEFAAPFWAMVQMLAGLPNMPTMADFEAVVGLGGGWKYATITPSEVEAAFVEEEARIAAEELRVLKKQLEDAAEDTLQTYREALASWNGTGDPPVLGGE